MIMCVLLCYPVSIRIYYQQGVLFLVFIFPCVPIYMTEFFTLKSFFKEVRNFILWIYVTKLDSIRKTEI